MNIEFKKQLYKLPHLGLFQIKPILSVIWEDFKRISKSIIQKYPNREIELWLNIESGELKCITGELSSYEVDKLLLFLQERICHYEIL